MAANDGNNNPAHVHGHSPYSLDIHYLRAHPSSPGFKIHHSIGDKIAESIDWNYNVIEQNRTFNMFNPALLPDGRFKTQERWRVPGRLYDGLRINSAPKNRTQLFDMDQGGWYTLSDFYGFDFRAEELSVEHCQARWCAFCGCRAMTIDDAKNGAASVHQAQLAATAVAQAQPGATAATIAAAVAAAVAAANATLAAAAAAVLGGNPPAAAAATGN